MLDFVNLVIASTEHSGGPSTPDLLSTIFGSNILFVSLVVIGIYVLLKKMNFVGKALDEPRQKIIDDLGNAEKTKENAIKELALAEEKLSSAQSEADKIISDARTVAEKMKEQILHEAKEEAEKIFSQAQKNIKAEQEMALNEIKNKLALAAVEVAEDHIKASLDTQWQETLIQNFVNNLSGVRVK